MVFGHGTPPLPGGPESRLTRLLPAGFFAGALLLVALALFGLWQDVPPTVPVDHLFELVFGTGLALFGLRLWLRQKRQRRQPVHDAAELLSRALLVAQLGTYRREGGTRELVWSEEASRILGFPPHLAPDTLDRLLSFVHPADREAVKQAAAIADSGRSCGLEYRVLDPKGRLHYIRDVSAPSAPSRQGAVLVQGIIQDMTPHREMERALRQARDAAEEANRSKTEFLANMSHELRTPLNAIIGFSEIMRDGLFGEVTIPRYREYLADINGSAQHLLLIINDILDIARIESGEVRLKEAAFSPAQMLEECGRMLGPRANEAEVALEVASEVGLADFIGDERLLRQVILNLGANSIKFTPAGGKVALRAGRDAAGGLVLSVQDTGIGMTAEGIELALKPFGQVQSAFGLAQDGVGLGLPLAKSYTELHGGELAIRSVPGRGTTVSVTLSPARLTGSPSKRPAAASGTRS